MELTRNYGGSAYELDSREAQRIAESRATGILHNPLNTPSHRLHNNHLRQASATRKAGARLTATNELEAIETELQETESSRKASQERVKELRLRKKDLVTATGVNERYTHVD